MGVRDTVSSFLWGGRRPSAAAPQDDFRGFLDATIRRGGSVAHHAQTVRDTIDRAANDQRLYGPMASMVDKATAMGGLVGINDYGIKGRRQYAAERRRLLDLYAIVLNSGDVRTATLHLRNEIFRRGLEWEPAFEFKCDRCDSEFTAKEAKRAKFSCHCREDEGLHLGEDGNPLQMEEENPQGGYPLRRPSPREIKAFDRFLDHANYFGQSLESILRQTEDDINVVDDGFIYFRCRYELADHEIAEAKEDPFNDKYAPDREVMQIFRMDPTLVEFDMDDRGVPGQGHHLCVFDRDVILDVPINEGWDIEWKGICPSCGLRTYPVYYKYSEQQASAYGPGRAKVLYLLDDEVIHWSRYSPCYDYDTEVMTRGGWKRIVDVEIGVDEVATRSPGGFLEWQGPTDKVVKPHTGPMWVAKGQRVDLVVTPHHKLWVRGAHSPDPGYTPMHEHDGFPRHHVATKHPSLGERNSGYEGPVGERLTTEFGLVEAYRIDNSQRIYMSNTAGWAGEDVGQFEIPGYESPSSHGRYWGGRAIAPRMVPMSDWLEFLGYWLTEGSYVPSGRRSAPVSLTQSSSANPENRRRMIECAERLGLHVTTPHEDKISVWHPGLRRYFEQFGRSRDRFIPAWLKDLPPARLSVLFDAVMRGDGHFDERGRPASFRSFSPKFLEDVAEVSIKLGYQTCFTGKTGLRFGVHQEADLCLNPGRYGLSHEKRRVGAVFGLEVQNHVMMVRRNGKTVWSGNTETYGFPPVLSIYEKAMTLIGMDRYLYDYFYERKVPQGVVTVVTDDTAAFNATKNEVEARMQQDPHYIPWMAIASKSGQGRMEFVRFAYSLDELDYLPVRDEIRERISGIYGVSQIWMQSLPPDAPVWVRKEGRFIDLVPIGSLYSVTHPDRGGDMMAKPPLVDGLKNGIIEALTRSGWRPITKVFAHRAQEDVVVVTTGGSSIEVTANHSLFDEGGREISAGDLSPGDLIELADLPDSPSLATMTAEKAWALGFYAAEGTVIRPGKNLVEATCRDDGHRAEFARCFESAYQRATRDDGLRVRAYGDVAQELERELFTTFLTGDAPGSMREITVRRVPKAVLNGSTGVMRAFVDGFMAGDGSVTPLGQRAVVGAHPTLMAGVDYLFRAIGMEVSVLYIQDKRRGKGGPQMTKDARSWKLQEILTVRKKAINEVKTVSKSVHKTGAWVYDLETEDGTFAGGIGGVLLHNSTEGIGGLNNESIPGDTPVWVRYDKEFIDCVPIAWLHNGSNRRLETVEALTPNGWSAINKVFRHMTDKPMFTVRAGDALLRVTGNHSVVVNGEKVAADEIKDGDRLSLVLPEATGSVSMTEDLAWLLGFFGAEGYASATRVCWSNTDEGLVRAAEARIRRAFGTVPKVYWRERKGVKRSASIEVQSKELAGWFTANATSSYRVSYGVHDPELGRSRRTDQKKCYKKVPHLVLNAGKDVMRSYLDGYVAGDGHTTPNGTVTQGSVDFPLAAGLQYLYWATGTATRANFLPSASPRHSHFYGVETLLGEEAGRVMPRRIEREEVRGVHVQEDWHDFVYDIEVADESHLFVGGIGGVVLSNSQQLTVMSRVVEGAQRSYHTDVFPKLQRALKIGDWHLKIRTPEETSELVEIQITQAKASVAQTFAGMGFGVEWDSETDEFSFHGRVLSAEEQQKAQADGASPFGGGGFGGPGGGAMPDQQRAAKLGQGVEQPLPPEQDPRRPARGRAEAAEGAAEIPGPYGT
jgi:intein/homing endonuclease